MGKNIVICCDGTGNQISHDATNIMRLWSTLVLDGEQVGFYDPGVGTLGDPRILSLWKRQLRKRLDAAIGLSIRENFNEAYSFLARVYEDGDRVYLLGFSRGAYTVRAIAGAVHLFGLLRSEHENLTPYLWRTFSNDDRDEVADTLFETARRFHARFTRKIPVHFVGVFDTVSAFGPITGFRTLPHTRDNPSVRIVRHAASIDERRACFRANLCDPGVDGQDFKEVWFAGVHADVGGGYPEASAALAKVALRWMLGEAHAAGLKLDPARCREALSAPAPDPNGQVHKSLKRWWWVLEFLPQRRWNHDRQKLCWRPPNFAGKRSMTPKGAASPPRVHVSVKARTGYKPGNLPPSSIWEDDGPLP